MNKYASQICLLNNHIMSLKQKVVSGRCLVCAARQLNSACMSIYAIRMGVGNATKRVRPATKYRRVRNLVGPTHSSGIVHALPSSTPLFSCAESHQIAKEANYDPYCNQSCVERDDATPLVYGK